ncbi:MAG TPA: fatty acid desaturase [Planctomycetota bacterium]|nr:fatty acid desaturase [Planctomycetota bacterium]
MSAARRYPIPWRLNLLVIALQLAAVGACMHGARVVESWTGLGLLALAFGAVMNSVYSTIHEAEHAILFPSRRWNDLAGVLLALLFPAPFHLIRQGHLGHHLRNRSDDEAFDLIIEGERPAWKRLQFYGIITGFYWVVVALGNLLVLVLPSALTRGNFEFDKASAAFMESLNPRYWKLIRLEALAAIILHAAILLGAGIPAVNYAIMYLGFGWMWSAMQYVHHFGTERHVTRGARNLWIWAPLDLVWLNHNWHLTHHSNPTVPWNHLPRLGVETGPGRGFLPWAYLRMWRGPRRSAEHVENRYAGQVIR